MEILFENGIPGFEEEKYFEISEMKDNDKFKLITSKENSNIGFVGISTFEVKKDYEIDLSNDTINELKIEDPKDVLVLGLITLGKTLEKSTVNLKAPVIINIKNNKGKQIILQDDRYSLKEPLI